MRGVVYYGEQFVEVPDASVTLKDIAASFGLTDDHVNNNNNNNSVSLNGVCIKHRATGRVVATLPFESLPAPSSTYTHKGDVEEGGDVEKEEAEVEVYDLCVPADTNDEKNNNSEADDMTDVLRQLVQLGATSLLSAESQGSLDVYDPRLSPGLLGRIIYPCSVYSPYRHSGDPLGRHSNNNNNNISLSSSGPYVGAPEKYTVHEATVAALRLRPDLVPQSEEEARDILHGLVAAATQVKAIMTLASEEEKLHAPVDVKPNVADIQMD